MPEQEDMHTVNREAMRERHQLGEALLTVAAEGYVLSLHRQNDDGRLWCIETHGTGQTTAAGGNPSDVVAWIGGGTGRILFGTVTPDTAKIWVATGRGERTAATLAQGVFCAVVAPAPLYLTTFHDKQGRMLQALPLLADTPEPSLRSRWVRWLTSLRLLKLPLPRYVYTYDNHPQQSGRRGR